MTLTASYVSNTRSSLRTGIGPLFRFEASPLEQSYVSPHLSPKGTTRCQPWQGGRRSPQPKVFVTIVRRSRRMHPIRGHRDETETTRIEDTLSLRKNLTDPCVFPGP